MKHPFKLGLISLALTQSVFADGIPTYQGNEIVVTATRFPQIAESTPTNVTVITQSDIQNSGARTLPEILAQQVGINARSTDGTSDYSLDMRGFGMTGNQNMVVLLDGQRLNENELTGIKWSAIPMSAIERIEIMRGTGAVLYGAGATGGVINIITRSPGKKPINSVELSIGSYNARTATINLETRGEKASIRISGSHLETDNYRKNNQERLNNLHGDVRYALDNGSMFLKFGAQDQTLRLPSERVVSPTQGIDDLSNDRRGTTSPSDHSANDNHFISTGIQHKLGVGELVVEAGFRNKNQEADFVRFGSYLKGDSDSRNLGIRYRLPYKTSFGSNTFITGIDVADWDYHSIRASSPTSPATANVNATQENRSFYFLNLSNIGNTLISVGGRSEWAEQEARDTLSNTSYASGKKNTNVRAYEMGIKHAISSQLSLFGKIGRSYRLPVVDEIYNQYGGPFWDSLVAPLQPQTSLDRELGVDFKASKLGLRASIYQMEVNNELHYNAISGQNMNLSPTEHQGFELESKLQLSDSLSGFLNYSYAEATFISGTYNAIDVTGKNIPLVPKHQINLGAVWRITSQTSIAADLQHVGSQVFDNDQDNSFGQKIPAYMTANMKLMHETGPWKWSLSLNNLFNEKYYTYGIRSRFTPGRYNAYPMPERNITLSGAYHF